jgi:curved DNA-binding protein CbpA
MAAQEMAISNAFEILGIAPGLTVSDEALREAFREAGKSAHPDAGGDDEGFANLREAFAIVSSPSRRLKHWLDLRGTPAETRGTVDPALMDLFSIVGAATQQAEAVIRKRDETKSALGFAMLERETHLSREAVEKAQRLVESAIAETFAIFPVIEASEVTDLDVASKTARNLAFLEKWQTSLRGVFARLV